MKDSRILIIVLALLTIMACSKESGMVSKGGNPPATVGVASSGRSNARLSGPSYSQSIPLDTANSMIQSYLTSVRYPAADTALRSLTFDADTLRSYLMQNPSIVSVKFIMAHQPAYKNGGGNGVYSGMKPQALTMVVVGLNEAGQYVLNSQNGVYEHMAPCPNHCPGTSSAIIQ